MNAEREFEKIKKLRNGLVKFCTSGNRRIDLGHDVQQDFSDRRGDMPAKEIAANAPEVQGYAFAEFIVDNSKLDQIIDYTNEFIRSLPQETKDELKSVEGRRVIGPHYHYFKRVIDSKNVAFMFLTELNDDDFLRFLKRYKEAAEKLTAAEKAELEDRQKAIMNAANPNTQLEAADRDEETTRLESIVPGKTSLKHY